MIARVFFEWLDQQDESESSLPQSVHAGLTILFCAGYLIAIGIEAVWAL